MPSFCGVINCGNRGNRDRKSFFRLPEIGKRVSEARKKLIAERRRKWLAALKRADLTEQKTKYMRICEDHFISGKPSALQDVDNPDWVPSKRMGYDTPNSDESVLKRFERRENRKKRKFDDIDQIGDAQDEDAVDGDAQDEDAVDGDAEDEGAADVDTQGDDDTVIDNLSSNCRTKSVFVQTDLTIEDINILYETFQNVQTELYEKKIKISAMTLDENNFKDNDRKVNYYTGIPNFVTLSIIFNVIKEFLSETPQSSLTRFQKFILTMIHLRLNLDFTDLGYRFQVSLSTASRAFDECLYIMHERLCDMVFWPERKELVAKVPLLFLETFGRKVTVVIDCFEIKIEKPSHLLAAAQCYSHYKHCHTIKYLIGISPQGVIIFLSSAWGGRTSDKHIVQNSGFLDELLPNDMVLADRGFNVKEEIELYCAQLKLPAYTRGKKQLDALDIESTRKLAHVRIHVERVIGQLRQKYRILSGTMPITLVNKSNENAPTTVDQILKVCCALINFCPSVIPFE